MSRFKSKGGLTAVACSLALTLGAGTMLWQPHVSGQEDAPAAVSSKAVAEANSLSTAFRQAAKVATPSVVKIRSHTNSKNVSAERRQQPRGRNGANPFQGTPFEDFFGEDGMPENFGQRTPQRDGVGSGVIIDKAGIVITNNHVVEGADEVTVHLPDGREFKASDIKTDPQSDLAVLRIKSDEELPAANLGDSDALEIGDWVIAIGSPFELETTVSAGIISGKGRELSSVRRSKFLQTDAAINPGNSGGPLLNLNGEVVGINTAIASNSGGYQGIGFAIPSNQVKWVTQQLIKAGSVQRGYLGIGIEEVTKDLAEQFDVKAGTGVLVSEVMPDSPAGKAGLQEGDVVLSFGGTAVSTPRQLQEVVERTAVDTDSKVEVVRGGKTMTLNVVVQALPEKLAGTDRVPSRSSRQPQVESYHAEKLGLEVSELTADTAKQLGFDGQQGVVVTNVDDDGLAAGKGMTAGMLIRKVGKTEIKNLEDFEAAVKDVSVEDGVLLQVRTQAGNRFVVLGGK